MKINSDYFSYEIFSYTDEYVNGGVPVRSKEKCLREHAFGLGTLLAHKLPCRNSVRKNTGFNVLLFFIMEHALLRVILQQNTFLYSAISYAGQIKATHRFFNKML